MTPKQKFGKTMTVAAVPSYAHYELLPPKQEKDQKRQDLITFLGRAAIHLGFTMRSVLFSSADISPMCHKYIEYVERFQASWEPRYNAMMQRNRDILLARAIRPLQNHLLENPFALRVTCMALGAPFSNQQETLVKQAQLCALYYHHCRLSMAEENMARSFRGVPWRTDVERAAFVEMIQHKESARQLKCAAARYLCILRHPEVKQEAHQIHPGSDVPDALWEEIVRMVHVSAHEYCIFADNTGLARSQIDALGAAALADKIYAHRREHAQPN